MVRTRIRSSARVNTLPDVAPSRIPGVAASSLSRFSHSLSMSTAVHFTTIEISIAQFAIGAIKTPRVKSAGSSPFFTADCAEPPYWTLERCTCIRNSLRVS